MDKLSIATSHDLYNPLSRTQEPKAPWTYGDYALSVVSRPPSVRIHVFTFSTPEPFNGFR